MKLPVVEGYGLLGSLVDLYYLQEHVASSSVLKMKVVHSSNLLVPICQIPWHHILQDHYLQSIDCFCKDLNQKLIHFDTNNLSVNVHTYV